LLSDFDRIAFKAFSKDMYLSRVRPQQVKHHSDGGGFARAIGSQETKNFSLPNIKSGVIHRLGFAEILAKVLNRYDFI